MDIKELINKKGTLFISVTVQQLWQKAPHLMESMLAAIEHYTAEFKRCHTEGKATDVLQAIYDLAEQANNVYAPPAGMQVQCRKGCAFCCHINVTVTKLEVKLMKDHARRKGNKIDEQQIKNQLDLNETTHGQSKFSQCAFLKNNTCSVYEARPFACRNYMVVSPPLLCDTKKFPHQQAVVFVNYEKEILHSAFLNYLQETGQDMQQDSIARIYESLKT